MTAIVSDDRLANRLTSLDSMESFPIPERYWIVPQQERAAMFLATWKDAVVGASGA